MLESDALPCRESTATKNVDGSMEGLEKIVNSLNEKLPVESTGAGD